MLNKRSLINDTFRYKMGDSDNIVRTDTHNKDSLEWQTAYGYQYEYKKDCRSILTR